MKIETRPVLPPQPRGDVRRVAGPRRGRGAPRRGSPTGRGDYASLELRQAALPRRSSRPASKTPEDYLRELCEQGLKRALRRPTRRRRPCERLDHELGIINRMGFASYFLIVWDFVRFAREKGIPGTARGSACGALVSYVLYLSHVCPLKYDLLFERFLDPNRTEAPDIDIDFCQDRRDEVIEYVKAEVRRGERRPDRHVRHAGRQGGDHATSAGCWASRCRGSTQVAKLVPDAAATSRSTRRSRKSPTLKRLYEQDPEIARAARPRLQLEGLARNVGTHAAGVVIADRPLDRVRPAAEVRDKDKDKEVVITQWAMGDVEKVGLLKMDFLGLRNLTILDNAVELIEQTHAASRSTSYKFPLDDQETFALLQRGETKGIFQLETRRHPRPADKMKPDHFGDIIATNALYRPGPLEGGMVDDYVDVKHGRKQAEYLHPVMKEILEETHGVMVYQEQVMRILNRLGGIELSQAYACIKAISKKKPEIIAKCRDAVHRRARSSAGLEGDQADEIFDLIEKFGGYGFNKSHSTAYALIAYQTAYLKAHYPAEFMAAAALVRDGRRRARQGLRRAHRRLPADGDRGPAARRQRRATSTSRSPPRARSTSAWPRSRGSGARRSRRSSRPASEGGPFTQPLRLLRARPAGDGQPGVRRDADQGRRVRRASGPGGASCWPSCPAPSRPGQAKQDDRKRGQRASSTPSSRRQRLRRQRPRQRPRRQSLPDVPELPDAELLAEEKKVARLLHVEPPPGPPRRRSQALADAPGRRPRRRRRQDRGHPRRHDHRRPGQERPEEPLGPDPDGQAHLRGPHRPSRRCSGPRSSPRSRTWSRTTRSASSRGRSTAAATPPSWSSARSSRSSGPRRAGPRGRRPAPQGGPRRTTTSSACSAWSGSGPGNLDLYLEILGLEQVRRADLQGGRVAEGPLRRPPARRPGGGRRRRQRPPARPSRGDRPRQVVGPGHGRRHDARPRRAARA